MPYQEHKIEKYCSLHMVSNLHGRDEEVTCLFPTLNLIHPHQHSCDVKIDSYETAESRPRADYGLMLNLLQCCLGKTTPYPQRIVYTFAYMGYDDTEYEI